MANISCCLIILDYPGGTRVTISVFKVKEVRRTITEKYDYERKSQSCKLAGFKDGESGLLGARKKKETDLPSDLQKGMQLPNILILVQ